MPEACALYFIVVVKGEEVAKMDKCNPRSLGHPCKEGTVSEAGAAGGRWIFKDESGRKTRCCG